MPRIQTNFYLYAENIERAVTFYQENFGFTLEGQIITGEKNEWAALRTENALIWLGATGAKTGLIILVEKNLAQFVDQLKKLGVTIFVPVESQTKENDLIETQWGKHTWILDSEKNIVMLFEPAEG